MRLGALIATGRELSSNDYCSLRLVRRGAAFSGPGRCLQIFAGDYGTYGKEIGGDLLEGQAYTLILIHVLKHCTTPRERNRIQGISPLFHVAQRATPR